MAIQQHHPLSQAIVNITIMGMGLSAKPAIRRHHAHTLLTLQLLEAITRALARITIIGSRNWNIFLAIVGEFS